MSIKLEKGVINGNTLKIIACICMVIDHIGAVFYPMFLSVEAYTIMRAIGRVAMPIFAFLIAEGCRYTKDKKKYFLIIFLLGIVCDIAYYVAMQQLYLCILTTFSLSILIIYAFDGITKSLKEKNGNTFLYIVEFAAVVAIAIFIDVWANKNDGTLDYGFAGVLLPFFSYIFKNKWLKLIPITIGILLLCFNPAFDSFSFPIQWFTLIPLVLFALYNGQRGKAKLKYFFYLFYPIHLLIIEGVFILMTLL